MSPSSFFLTQDSSTLSAVFGAQFSRSCSPRILLVMRRLELKNESADRLAAIKNRLADRFHSSWHNDPPQVDVYCSSGHELPRILSESLLRRASDADNSAFSVAWIYWDLKSQPVAHHELARYADDIISSLPKNCYPALIVHTKEAPSLETDELLKSVKEHLNGTTPVVVIRSNHFSLIASNHPDSIWQHDAAAKALAATFCYPLLKELLAKICEIFPDDKEQAADLKLFRQIFLDTFNDQ